MNSLNRCVFVSVLTGVCLAATTGAYAQISSINSAVITPRVYNDIPGATGTYLNSYPGSITLGEAGVSQATGFADRDIWQFSNDGSTAYTVGAGDTAFTASFTLNLSPDTGTIDNEAGWIIPNANGSFPGGDMQFLAKGSQDHFVGFFGGPGFWNSGLAYTAGSPVTMTMSYWQTGATGNMQFSVNGVLVSPVQSWTGSLVGDTIGAYFQIQNDPNNSNNGAQAVFSDISISVPEPATLALLGLGLVPMARLLRRRA